MEQELKMIIHDRFKVWNWLMDNGIIATETDVSDIINEFIATERLLTI